MTVWYLGLSAQMNVIFRRKSKCRACCLLSPFLSFHQSVAVSSLGVGGSEWSSTLNMISILSIYEVTSLCENASILLHRSSSIFKKEDIYLLLISWTTCETNNKQRYILYVVKYIRYTQRRVFLYIRSIAKVRR